jgi:hypothetical protein
MRKQLLLAIVLCIAGILSGCHNDLDIEDLPFTEVLVIRGVLTEGEALQTLYVARTTQYEEKYYQHDGRTVVDDFKGWVTDGAVDVECDGKHYPMTYRAKGNYGNDTLVIEAGKTYHLTASWNGHHAEAMTTVPRSISIDSVHVDRTLIETHDDFADFNYTFTASVRNHMNSVFYLTVVYGPPSQYNMGNGWNDVCKIENAASASNVDVRITCKESAPVDPVEFNRIPPTYSMIVQSFDEPYYFYRLSTGGQLSSQIAWNVSGDAIGMFIGASKPVYKTFTMHI